jgi:HlyD family secretion protein
MRNKVIAAVIIVALVAGGGWYVYNKRTKAAAAKNDVRYITAKVQRGDIRSTISGTGPVASVNGVTVKSNQTGTVTQILAQDGDRVKTGQVIMVLDNPTLQSQLQQAQVDLETAQKNLTNLLHPQDTAVQAQQLKVENAQLTLKQRQQDQANLTVKAPQAGVVTAVNTTEGSNITNGALLVTLFDDSNPTFVVGLSQQAASQVKVGDKVTVDVNGFGKVTGTVQQSAGAATPGSGNRDATVPVQVSLPATPGLRPGMVGQATFNVPGLNYVLQGSGSIKSQVVEVRSQVAATVGQIAVKEGERVKAGDLLVKLTSDTINLNLAQAQNDVKVQQQALVNLIDPSQDPSGQAESLQNKLNSAQITLTQRQSDIGDLQIKAPVDGVISGMTFRVGDKITNNQSLFRVADYGMMQTTISVDELDIAKVKVGQAADILLDALPNKGYKGKVTKVNPEGVFKNDIANFDVTVSIDNPAGVMAGMNSTVNVAVEDKPGVLWVPAQAVTVRQGRASIQVMGADGQPQTKEIQIGLRTTNQIEVTSGLNEGETVVVTTIRPTTTSGAGFNLFGGNRQQQQQQGAPGANGTQGTGGFNRQGGAGGNGAGGFTRQGGSGSGTGGSSGGR